MHLVAPSSLAITDPGGETAAFAGLGHRDAAIGKAVGAISS